jgi:putative colanic acid biosynthesis acetyltransferase WcaF
MGLITRPIVIEDGAWITSRCIVLGGVTVGRNAIVKAGSRVDVDVSADVIWDDSGTVKDRDITA